MQNTIQTLQKQIFPNGEGVSMYSAEAFRANRSALHDREKEQMMTVISGRKCYEPFEKSNRLGLLVKMLVESSRWYSPARRLNWVAQPLFSEKTTRMRKCTSSSLSRPYVQTLSVRDIPSSRYLFRLVPSVRHIEETGFGLLPTVQTQGLKRCNADGKTEFLPLELLPTPRANKVNDIDLNNPQMAQRNKGNLEEAIAKIIQNTPCEDGKISQLNPLFVEEMMGFPLMWTTLPYLLHNGEKSQSKPTVTP